MVVMTGGSLHHLASGWLAPRGVDTEGLALETMILKTVGNAVLIAGDEQGVRHAVYALLVEYCRAGFGPAAGSVPEYWGIFEELRQKSRREGADIADVYEEADLRRLRETLDEAAELAQDAEDEKTLRRLEFPRKGLKFGELSFRFRRERDDEAREALEEFLKRAAHEDPLALCAPMVRAYVR